MLGREPSKETGVNTGHPDVGTGGPGRQRNEGKEPGVAWHQLAAGSR